MIKIKTILYLIVSILILQFLFACSDDSSSIKSSSTGTVPKIRKMSLLVTEASSSQQIIINPCQFRTNNNTATLSGSSYKDGIETSITIYFENIYFGGGQSFDLKSSKKVTVSVRKGLDYYMTQSASAYISTYTDSLLKGSINSQVQNFKNGDIINLNGNIDYHF